jgi:hypothetical protein
MPYNFPYSATGGWIDAAALMPSFFHAGMREWPPARLSKKIVYAIMSIPGRNSRGAHRSSVSKIVRIARETFPSGAEVSWIEVEGRKSACNVTLIARQIWVFLVSY